MSANLLLTHAGDTDTGRVRQANEDNWGHVKLGWGHVFVVCDGMGGHIGGAKASAIAVKSILEFLSGDDAVQPAVSIAKAIEFANEQIYATALNQPELKGMGTTCVVLLQKGDGLWIGHVGDSRAYIWHDGQLHRLTRDHSFVQQLIDSGSITEEEAERHARRNELLRALGVRGSVEPEVTSQPILPATGDLFLLCSDGLYGMVFDDGIRGVLRQGLTLDATAQRLIEVANEAGGTDNITAQLIGVGHSPHKGSRFQAITIANDLRKTVRVANYQGGTQPVAEKGLKPFIQRYPILLGVALLGLVVAGVLWATGALEEKNGADSVLPDSAKTELVVPDSLKVDSSKVDSAKLAPVKDAGASKKECAPAAKKEAAPSKKSDPPVKKEAAPQKGSKDPQL